MSGHTDSPPPLAEQARELLLRVRELEATVARVRELAEELPVNFWAAVATGPVESAYRDGFDAGLRSAAGDIRRALDGDQ